MKVLNDQPIDGGDLKTWIAEPLQKAPKLDSLKMIDLKRDIDFKSHVREDSISVNMLERAQCLWNYPDVSVISSNLNANQFIGEPKIKQLLERRLKPVSFFDHCRQQADQHNNLQSSQDDPELSQAPPYFDDEDEY